jgi:formylglycine-generating enzyme required for sulfatase activity
MKQLISILLLFCGFIPTIQANNLRFADLVLLDASTLSLKISWDNSWYIGNGPSAGSHDAIWVFVKVKSNGTWQHLQLATIDSLHETSSNQLEIKAVSDSNGVFVKQTALGGSQSFQDQSIMLKLASPLSAGSYSFKVFGIEMVYVSEGDFTLGDGISNHTFQDSVSGQPIPVSSSSISLGIASNQLSTGFPLTITTSPASYPTGYKAFYAMKYEISQQQYAEFLNCLTLSQQTNRLVKAPSSSSGTYIMNSTGTLANRNGLVIAQPSDGQNSAQITCNLNPDNGFDQSDDGQNLAMNFLAWADLIAYLDWAGLRPLTEMEFEKACSEEEDKLVPLGFAWGTAYSVDANTLVNPGNTNETVVETATDSAGLANHGYAGVQGPLRCGFGGNESSNRLQAGASRFGLLEMSGNLWEQCVTTNDQGFQFGYRSGNGRLADSGDSDEANWYPGAENAIYRGGAWLSGISGNFRDLAVADRFYLNLRPAFRRNTSGGRGCRSVTW